MKWILDGTIDLTEICENSEAHHLTIIEALEARGLDRKEAQDFASFIGNEYCVERGGVVDCKSEDYLTDEQWERLSV